MRRMNTTDVNDYREIRGNNMKVLSKEKFKVLAEINGWSHDHAKGYVDGEICRRRGTMPPKYAQIGIDEYCLGFRAGYYERKNARLMRPADPVAPVKKAVG